MRTRLLSLFLLASLSAIAQTKTAGDNEATLHVKVTDFQNKIKKSETLLFESAKTKKTYSGTTDSTGKFSIIVPKGDTYAVKVKTFAEDMDYSSVEIPAGAGKINMKLDVQIELPKTYTLDDVFFDSGKSTLKPESFKALNELVEAMKVKKTLVIEIAGHTDNVGNSESNQKLSQNRANEVRAYLLRKGIPSVRVVAKGYGDAEPVEDNASPEGRQKNRRTEVRIIAE